MDQAQRQHIEDDLKGLVKGELLFDDLSRALYSTDASIFQVRPLGVIVPRDEEDVQILVRYAQEKHLALVPRGAGSGVAGEALGTGLIVDLTRHFRSILEVGNDTVRVQPGVVHRELNARLATAGRRFAPDPASTAQCTIGGMLATNASGSRVLRHGYTRDHVRGLRVVFDTGDAAALGREPRFPDPNMPRRLQDITRAVAGLLHHSADLIASCQPRTPYNRCGYQLDGILSASHVDLARLLVGSEGTLAVFTEASLQTVPLPAGRALVLFGFSSLEGALRAAQRALPSQPAACDLLDRRVLTLARSSNANMAALIPAAVEAVLLVEYESDTAGGAARDAGALLDQLQLDRLAALALKGTEAEEIERLWRLRESALPSLYGLRGGAQPIPFIEDVGVPPEEMAEYLLRVQELLQKHETTASFLIHAGTGQIHTRPFLDLQIQTDVDKLWALADEIYALALKLGGTISSQHGTGLARTPWVERQYGKLYPAFRELKAIFDPHRVFNPGKIVGPDPGLPAWPLRGSAREEPRRQAETLVRKSLDTLVGQKNGTAEAGLADTPPANGATSPSPSATPAPQLRWQPGELLGECRSCNGCGQCRTEASQQRMCPMFRVVHTEAATPRAKANLLRYLLEDSGDAQWWTSDAVREVADLCVNCKMCASECPAHVNVPKLMLEAKAANVVEHGLRRGDWIIARTEAVARLGCAFATPVNAALRSRLARWLLEKLFGLSRRRRLPTFARYSFLSQAARRGWTRKPRGGRPRVAYFVDIFANYIDPQIAEATVAVLHHNGIEVYVPAGQRSCGIAPLAAGDAETARESATRNLRLLADLARDGYRIVCSEPTAAVMLKIDYPDLVDDPDVGLVAEHTVELTSYLRELHRRGQMRTNFSPLPVSVGHHVPCHLKALGHVPAGPDLLALIPDLRVHTIDVSCSGMAGTFGLKAENYNVSLAAGRPMLEELSRPRVLFGSTECSTCRMQMEEGSGKVTLHPVQYLALAYGLLPEIARRLRTPLHP
jgi:FAD/FMN-containing dehydrogenase/Fe-S oxidoreductase